MRESRIDFAHFVLLGEALQRAVRAAELVGIEFDVAAGDARRLGGKPSDCFVVAATCPHLHCRRCSKSSGNESRVVD